MKKLTSILFFLIIILLVGCTNKPRIAYFNSGDLLNLIPETKTIDSTLKSLSKDLNSQFNSKQEKFLIKYNAFIEDSLTFKADVKELKRQELVMLQDDAKTFQENANKQLNSKRTELTTPFFKKINDLVAEIAKEKGYDYVLDSGTTPFIYKKESEDILPILKQRLGLK